VRKGWRWFPYPLSETGLRKNEIHGRGSSKETKQGSKPLSFKGYFLTNGLTVSFCLAGGDKKKSRGGGGAKECERATRPSGTTKTL